MHHFLHAKQRLMMYLKKLSVYYWNKPYLNCSDRHRNLIDNYSHTSGSLCKFKRDEPPANNADLNVNNGVFNFQSFKYKAALVRKTEDAVNNTNSSVKNTKIVVPLKYLSNFWRSLEMLLINCKIHHELNWIEDCILSNDGHSAKFKMKGAKSHVPIVTLSSKGDVNLKKQLSDGFKRSAYRDSNQTIPAKVIEKGKTYMIYLVHHFKGLKDYLVLLILLQQVLMLMKKQG